MEVQKISEIFIKPSSTTPPHLKTYKVSLIDQFFGPSLHIPIILFYLSKDNSLPSKMSILLKQSLSQTLTHYYPLAGRINNTQSIDCNDEGVYYIEAKANTSLSEYLVRPDLPSLNNLLPRQDKRLVTMIQETTFACGSVTIGILGAHMAMDGISFDYFLKYWAATAQESNDEMLPPSFEGPSIFPRYESYPENANLSFPGPFLRTGKMRSRRFLLDASAVADLKALATTSRLANPTRVEAVSACFMKCVADILKETSSGIDKAFAFVHSVSFRKRATPSIPENSMGNFIQLAPAVCLPEEIKVTDLAYKQREAIRKIDSVLVEIIKNEGYNKLHELLDEVFGDLNKSVSLSENGINCVAISSWCNFGLKEVDFGWGKPCWVSSAFPAPDSEVPFLNVIILMDAPVDKGIEVWVIMDEEDLILLEKHKDLLQFASLNPCPFKLDDY